MGGPISLLLAQRHPDLVRGMVLEATSLEWRATWWDRLTWRGLVVLEVVPPVARLAVARTACAVRRLANANPEIEPYLGWIQAEARRGDPTGIIEAGRALAPLRRPAASPARSGLPGVGGHHHPATTPVTPAKQRSLASVLAATTFELAADHFAFWAHAKEFSDVTRQAVDDVVSRLVAAEQS